MQHYSAARWQEDSGAALLCCPLATLTSKSAGDSCQVGCYSLLSDGDACAPSSLCQLGRAPSKAVRLPAGLPPSAITMQTPRSCGHTLLSALQAATDKVGVLLLNLGGPDRLEDVEKFLFNLFNDPDIIRLPPQGKPTHVPD